MITAANCQASVYALKAVAARPRAAAIRHRASTTNTVLTERAANISTSRWTRHGTTRNEIQCPCDL